MRTRAACALALAAALGACAFWSNKPFFTEAEGAAPIADGARLSWIEDGGNDEQIVVYRRVGAGYEVAADDPEEADEALMAVLFVEVRETPEEDYIAQVRLRPDEESRAYAFMWRTERGYRVVSAPRVALEDERGEMVLARYCAERPNGECRFARADDLTGFYLEAIHPAFVVAGETPSDYIDQIPVAGAPEGK